VARARSEHQWTTSQDWRGKQHWEFQDHIASVANFAALAQVLGVSMDALFHGEEGAARIAEERAGVATLPDCG
jgi:hypothetical protein